MTPASEAANYLAQSGEFLTVAAECLDQGRLNAAVSNAAHAGINAKDAICLALTGRTGKAEDHTAAVAELRRVGAAGAKLAPTLGRLIRLKPKAEYRSEPIGHADAARAVAWARRLYDGAQLIVR